MSPSSTGFELTSSSPTSMVYLGRNKRSVRITDRSDLSCGSLGSARQSTLEQVFGGSSMFQWFHFDFFKGGNPGETKSCDPLGSTGPIEDRNTGRPPFGRWHRNRSRDFARQLASSGSGHPGLHTPILHLSVEADAWISVKLRDRGLQVPGPLSARGTRRDSRVGSLRMRRGAAYASPMECVGCSNSFITSIWISCLAHPWLIRMVFRFTRNPRETWVQTTLMRGFKDLDLVGGSRSFENLER